MKLRTGDRVICILDSYNWRDELIHKRNNIYMIYYITERNFIYISYDDDNLFGYNRKEFMMHFNSIKDHRKLKLEKIKLDASNL